MRVQVCTGNTGHAEVVQVRRAAAGEAVGAMDAGGPLLCSCAHCLMPRHCIHVMAAAHHTAARAALMTVSSLAVMSLHVSSDDKHSDLSRPAAAHTRMHTHTHLWVPTHAHPHPQPR
jgi:hypothetical protein